MVERVTRGRWELGTGYWVLWELWGHWVVWRGKRRRRRRKETREDEQEGSIYAREGKKPSQCLEEEGEGSIWWRLKEVAAAKTAQSGNSEVEGEATPGQTRKSGRRVEGAGASGMRVLA